MRVLVVPTGLLAGLALEDIVLIRLLALLQLLVTALLAQGALVNLAALDRLAQRMALVVVVVEVIMQTTLPV
jgi:hypothetical protein